MHQGPRNVQPIQIKHPCHTLHRGLFSSKAKGPPKLIRPENCISGNSKMVQRTSHFDPAAAFFRNHWTNGETVNTAILSLPFFDHKPVLYWNTM